MRLVRVKRGDDSSEAKEYMRRYCADLQKTIASKFPELDFVGISFHGDERLGYWVDTNISVVSRRDWKESRQRGIQMVNASKELEKAEKLVKATVKQKFPELRMVN